MRLLLSAFLVLGPSASLAAQGKALKPVEFELGRSAVLQQAVGTAADRNFTSGRAAAIYKHLVTETPDVAQTAEYLPNLQNGRDWRLNPGSALVAPLSSAIGIKMALTIRYQNLPDPGFLPTDRLFSTGIQVTY